MSEEFSPTTNTEKQASMPDFQSVQTSMGGKTGERLQEASSGKVFYADTVKGILKEHSDKLFSIISLIGFTFVFHSGNIKSWDDFWRYSAFLLVVLIFHFILSPDKSD